MLTEDIVAVNLIVLQLFSCFFPDIGWYLWSTLNGRCLRFSYFVFVFVPM